MTSVHLDLIKEIDRLWDPVYPYLAKQIHELYGRKDGNILEIGPFCGTIFALHEQNIGSSFLIATFPQGMGSFFCQEVMKMGLEKKINVIETETSLSCVKENTVDLAIFRGALFFPSLFQVNLSAVHRILRTNGVAFIGGGFGKFTPRNLIKDIGAQSRDLNLRIGKIEVRLDKIWQNIKASKLKGKIAVISEGGLWVVIKK